LNSCFSSNNLYLKTYTACLEPESRPEPYLEEDAGEGGGAVKRADETLDDERRGGLDTREVRVEEGGGRRVTTEDLVGVDCVNDREGLKAREELGTYVVLVTRPDESRDGLSDLGGEETRDLEGEETRDLEGEEIRDLVGEGELDLEGEETRDLGGEETRDLVGEGALDPKGDETLDLRGDETREEDLRPDDNAATVATLTAEAGSNTLPDGSCTGFSTSTASSGRVTRSSLLRRDVAICKARSESADLIDLTDATYF
jgi:hypothetical protein